MPHEPWTAEEEATGARLLSEGASNETFLTVMGRSKQSYHQRKNRQTFKKSGREYRALVLPVPSPRMVIPPEVIEDALRRAAEQRTITAILCGDPESCRRRL